jgi:hypothetical protein
MAENISAASALVLAVCGDFERKDAGQRRLEIWWKPGTFDSIKGESGHHTSHCNSITNCSLDFSGPFLFAGYMINLTRGREPSTTRRSKDGKFFFEVLLVLEIAVFRGSFFFL